jgi:uncharacterized membrane protein
MGDSSDKQLQSEDVLTVGSGVGIGAALGIVFGVMTGQLALGIAIGTALGVVAGSIAEQRRAAKGGQDDDAGPQA